MNILVELKISAKTKDTQRDNPNCYEPPGKPVIVAGDILVRQGTRQSEQEPDWRQSDQPEPEIVNTRASIGSNTRGDYKCGAASEEQQPIEERGEVSSTSRWSGGCPDFSGRAFRNDDQSVRH